MILADNELVEFHQLQHGEEGDDHLRLGGGGLEKGIKRERLAGGEAGEEKLDLVGDGVAVIDDVGEVMVLLEAF